MDKSEKRREFLKSQIKSLVWSIALGVVGIGWAFVYGFTGFDNPEYLTWALLFFVLADIKDIERRLRRR